VPSIDGGVTFPDIDVTAGASYIPFQLRAGVFVFPKTPTAGASLVLQSGDVLLKPFVYNVYIINRSGVTINSGWTLKGLGVTAQYT